MDGAGLAGAWLGVGTGEDSGGGADTNCVI